MRNDSLHTSIIHCDSMVTKENTMISELTPYNPLLVPLVLLLLSYMLKAWIHTVASWSSAGKLLLEAPIDLCVVLITLLVTYNYIYSEINSFLFIIIIYIVSMIIYSVMRRCILAIFSKAKIKGYHYLLVGLYITIDCICILFSFIYVKNILLQYGNIE